MYDLPSEDPEEPGLPDEFHDIQPQLLKETFCSPTYPSEQVFVGTDLNIYYDSRQPQWYKRPDWFVALGVQQSQSQQDLRLSYVVWQEGVNPFLVVELLSPGTEDEDLGRSLRDTDQPPTKWNVYERVLRVPYYVVFSRYTGELQVFEIKGVRYQALVLTQNRFWLPEVELGLGVWQGSYAGVEGQWLRWYDVDDKWVPTPQERAEQAEHQLEQAEHQLELERSRAQQLRERLRSLGIDPDEL